MVEKRLENEVEQVIDLISQNKNFLLSGGAGSGKTYSLIQVVTEIIKINPTKNIACMTYTNASVKDIQERVNHNNLRVSTIHDFLWDNIKYFQKDLKKSIINLITEPNSKLFDADGSIDKIYFESQSMNIQYGENARIKNGIISHDELIELASYMFKNYPLLCSILKDKYPFILIDEYQDTHPLVLEIFLKHLKQSKKLSVFGFFGDSMQSIYDDGIGSLEEYLEKEDVIEVKKVQNRRNPKLVIDLANRLRIDGLMQEPSEDKDAPNMMNGKIKNGSITFLYSLKTELDYYEIEKIKSTETFEDWDFNNPKQTKELYLTHNLIAPRAGFTTLMNIYDKDQIIDLKNELNRKIKKDKIVVNEDYTFEQVIDQVRIEYKQGKNKGFLKKDILIKNSENKESYEQLRNVLFSKVKQIYLDRDCLIDDKKQDENDKSKNNSKRDNLIKHIFKIQSLIQLYKNNSLNEFIRKTEFYINSVSDKEKLKGIISIIENMSESTIEEVIECAHDTGLCKKDDKFLRFVEEKSYIFNKVKKVKFTEFQNLYSYLEGYTPFSTQHKIKGAEFNNVLVVLDNGKWNNFNFQSLFTDTGTSDSVLSRTKKIFYVCCTRAKDKLVVYYHNPSDEIIQKANQWFGKDNVKMLATESN